MKITMRQYAFLAWLFEYPVDYRYSVESFLDSGHAQKVQDNLIEKGLVKIVKYDNEFYNRCLEDYKDGKRTKEDLDWIKEYSYQNLDKVWAYRKWMTHEEYAETNLKEGKDRQITSYPVRRTPFPLPASLVSVEDRNHRYYDLVHDCEYPTLTEKGVVAVIRKFGIKADSKLKVSAPEPYAPKASHKAKWRVEWVETTV